MSKKEQLRQILRDKYLAENPQIALKDLLETQQLVPLIEKFMEKMNFITPTVGQDYFTESDKAMFYSALYNELRANIKDGEQGIQGPKGDTGAQGIRGEAGKTPVRGIDYFTKEDVAVFTAMIMSKFTAMEKMLHAKIDTAASGIPDMVTGHVETLKKDIPTGDSVVSQILKHPLLRVLLHGGGGTSTGGTTNFVDDEVVSGSGTAWTLASAPVAGSVKLYALGQRLTLTTDYSIIGTAITTVSSWNSGELLADYRTS